MEGVLCHGFYQSMRGASQQLREGMTGKPKGGEAKSTNQRRGLPAMDQ
jgi:hypothetical protein